VLGETRASTSRRVANNHAFDFGRARARSTRTGALREAGRDPPSAAGRAEGRARAADPRGARGCAWEPSRSPQQVNHSPGRGSARRVARRSFRSTKCARSRARVDVVLVSVHWGGTSFVETPTPGAGRDGAPSGGRWRGRHHRPPSARLAVGRALQRPAPSSTRSETSSSATSPPPATSRRSSSSRCSAGARPDRPALRFARSLLEGTLGGRPTPVTGRRAAPIIARIRASSRRFSHGVDRARRRDRAGFFHGDGDNDNDRQHESRAVKVVIAHESADFDAFCGGGRWRRACTRGAVYVATGGLRAAGVRGVCDAASRPIQLHRRGVDGRPRR
jgi:hypothetical protein